MVSEKIRENYRIGHWRESGKAVGGAKTTTNVLDDNWKKGYLHVRIFITALRYLIQ